MRRGGISRWPPTETASCGAIPKGGNGTKSKAKGSQQQSTSLCAGSSVQRRRHWQADTQLQLVNCIAGTFDRDNNIGPFPFGDPDDPLSVGQAARNVQPFGGEVKNSNMSDDLCAEGRWSVEWLSSPSPSRPIVNRPSLWQAVIMSAATGRG